MKRTYCIIIISNQKYAEPQRARDESTYSVVLREPATSAAPKIKEMVGRSFWRGARSIDKLVALKKWGTFSPPFSIPVAALSDGLSMLFATRSGVKKNQKFITDCDIFSCP